MSYNGKIGPNWAYAEYDALARVWYDYGFNLDLGSFNANLNSGAWIDIDGQYDSSGLSDISLGFNIEPITLNWRLQSPQFSAWAYLGYEAKLELSAAYNINTGIFGRYSDEFTFIDLYTAGTIGGQTGFGSGEVYEDTAVVDGFNGQFQFGNESSDSAETNSTRAPQSIAWTEKFGKYLNFNLYDIGIPKPKLNGSSIEISSDFKIFELSGDLDQAIADWTGIPISGDYRFGWGDISANAQWSAVDITPTFALNGYYDISLDLNIPESVNIYNAESAANRSEPLVTIHFDDYENGIAELLEMIPEITDDNENQYLDLELEIKPYAALSGGLGLNPEIYVDWSALSAEVAIDVFGKGKKFAIGPIFPERREIIWSEEFDIVNEQGLDLNDIIPIINVPISIPAQIVDDTVFNTELFKNLQRFDLSSNVEIVQLKPLDTIFKKPIEVTLDAEFQDNITFTTTPGLTYGSREGELAVSLPDPINTNTNRKFIFMDESFEVYSITENDGLDKKTIKLEDVPSNDVSFGSNTSLESVSYNDSEGSNTRIQNNRFAVGSSILNMKDGDDSFDGPLQGSVISMGPGNDVVRGTTSDTGEGYITPLQTEREALFNRFHPSALLNFWQSSKRNTLIDMGDGSDTVYFSNFIKNSTHTDLTVNLDDNHVDIIGLIYNNGGNTHTVRIAGDEASRGKTDVVEIAWNGNDSGIATNLQAVTVNHPIGSKLPENASRTSIVAFAGIEIENGIISDEISYLGGTQQVRLDYSQMAPDPNGEDYKGVKLEINGAVGYQTPDIDGLEINTGFYPIETGYLGENNGTNHSNGAVNVVGSNLNDVFIINEHISGIEGNGGYDTYILNSAYAPLSYFSSFNSPYVLGGSPIDDEIFVQSFIADQNGHSVVKIEEGGLDSFYNFGEFTYTSLPAHKIFFDLNPNNYYFDADLIPANAPSYNMETWALDLSSINNFNTENMYAGSDLEYITMYPGESDRATEVILGGGTNVFDADKIWADPFQDRIDESSYMFYQLSNGFDTIYSRSKLDVFFVTEGKKSCVTIQLTMMMQLLLIHL